MKKLIVTLLFVVWHLSIYASLGNCIWYKAKFELKSGKAVEGYFCFPSWDLVKFKFTEKEFNKFIENYLKSRDTLRLILKFQALKYPHAKYVEDGQTKLKAVIAEDIVKLCKNDIITSHYLGFLKNDNEYINYKSTKSYWDDPRIIDELNQQEIDSLQYKPVATYKITRIIEYEDYYLLSYNKAIKEKELLAYKKRFIALKKMWDNCKDKNSSICFIKEYTKIKQELRNKNVVMFGLVWID